MSVSISDPMATSRAAKRRHSLRAGLVRNRGQEGTPLGFGSLSFSGRLPGLPIMALIAVGFGRRPIIQNLSCLPAGLNLAVAPDASVPLGDVNLPGNEVQDNYAGTAIAHRSVTSSGFSPMSAMRWRATATYLGSISMP